MVHHHCRDESAPKTRDSTYLLITTRLSPQIFLPAAPALGAPSLRPPSSASLPAAPDAMPPLRPHDIFERLNGMEVKGTGTWSARLDIAAERSCWLIRCSGQRLTTEVSATDPNEWDSRPEAEMCVWYKSAKLFMKNAKGLLNEQAFAAEYVKGSIRMTGDREKAQASTCHPRLPARFRS